MIVKELIELLQKMPQELEVFLDYRVDLVDPTPKHITKTPREPYVCLNAK